LIDALKKYDLVDNYTKLTPEQLKDLSRMLIVYYTSRFPADYQTVQLAEIEEHVSALYRQFHRTRDQIKSLQTSFATTQTDYRAWQELRRDILLGALREVADLMVASIGLAGEFRKAGETDRELVAKLTEAKDQAHRIVESWFLIKDSKYVEAVVNLLPIITTVIQSNPDLQSYLIGKLADNKDKLTGKNAPLRSQLVQWDIEKVEMLLKKLTPAVQAEIAAWNTESGMTVQKLKERLAKNNLPELEILTTSTSIPIGDVITFLTKVEKVKDVDKMKNLDLDFKVASAFALTFLQFTELNEKVQDIITIAAEVSTSVEADDITNVLLKYSLPPASYRIKRQEKFALMLNAYTGIGTNLTANRYLIISAPLGLEASFRFKNRKSSISVLATPIDLGNAINYQLLGSDTNSEKEIFSWANIYSPGAFLIYGISKNHPFSIGAGYQANPSRFSMFIAFDLPIIRIK
jgi:FtsZ-binding cell division protein ZapB